MLPTKKQRNEQWIICIVKPMWYTNIYIYYIFILHVAFHQCKRHCNHRPSHVGITTCFICLQLKPEEKLGVSFLTVSHSKFWQIHLIPNSNSWKKNILLVCDIERILLWLSLTGTCLIFLLSDVIRTIMNKKKDVFIATKVLNLIRMY